MSELAILTSLFSGKISYTNLDINAFEKKIKEAQVVLLDVRTDEEYTAGHLKGAVSIDWFSKSFMEQVQAAYPKGSTLAVYCRSGRRSAAAAAKLSAAGYIVYNMSGGYLAWAAAGKETTK